WHVHTFIFLITGSRQSDQLNSDMTRTKVSKFLEAFPIPHPQHMKAAGGWILWSGSSSSADLGTPINMIQDKIRSALCNTVLFPVLLAQFWEPVAIGSRRVLSTSGQPFAIRNLSNELALYRLYSEKYNYNMDVNKGDDTERDHMIISGGPATAFLSGLPYIYDLQWIPLQDDDESFNVSVMLPICFPCESYCIGVIEFTMDYGLYDMGHFVLRMIKEIKKAGLDVFYVQHLIPYQTIKGLKHVKEEIEKAIRVVCESHNLALAQVWIASNVPSSYSLEETETKLSLALKLTGYFYAESSMSHDGLDYFEMYCSLCDVISSPWKELAQKTLQDYKSRCNSKNSAVAICLRSIDTGDFDYAFEFFWSKRLNSTSMLESILSTLKRCLPGFRFASGAELDEESDVIDVSSYTDIETINFKIFQGKRLSLIQKAFEEEKKPIVKCLTAEIPSFKFPLGPEVGDKLYIDIESSTESEGDETTNKVKRLSPMPIKLEAPGKGKNPMGLNYKKPSPSEVRRKTAPIELSFEKLEEQFGKTMEEAAENLDVSKSTLKRRWKEHFENSGQECKPWPGPRLNKRKGNDSPVTPEPNEEVNGAIQEPPTDHIMVTVEAHYARNMIRFPLRIWEATFATIEEKIGMKFKLSVGSYMLKYLDEAGREILLTSDDEMSYCIESSKKPDGRIVLQVSVQPSTPY
ncbi:hypothetical protein SSX86_032917, partial [Deinandra increscens subsp. villosa]